MTAQTTIHRYQAAVARAAQHHDAALEKARREYEKVASEANTIAENCPVCGHLRAWHGEVGCKFRNTCGCDISLLRFGNRGVHVKEEKKEEM